MCESMVDIQSPTAEIRGGKRRKKKMERNYWMKIYMVSLLHRATIKEEERTNHSVKIYMVSLFHRATIINRTQWTAEGSVFWSRQSAFFVCVWNISRELLNGFVPNSHGSRVWSLARMSLKVKVTGDKNSIFRPFRRPACGLCLVKHLHPLVKVYFQRNFKTFSNRVKVSD